MSFWMIISSLREKQKMQITCWRWWMVWSDWLGFLKEQNKVIMRKKSAKFVEGNKKGSF